MFVVLAFSGFEGAATLGEETRQLRHTIPLAILGTLGICGALYVLIAYAQISGYGTSGIGSLAHSEAPLSVLSLRYLSPGYAALIDAAATISSFATSTGALAAAGRMLFALGRAGLSSNLGKVEPRYGVPTRAILVVSIVSLASFAAIGMPVGAVSSFGSLADVGGLALILVYLAVTSGAVKTALLERHKLGVAISSVGAILLIWPLVNSAYSIPNWPDNLWPYAVVAWLVVGAMLAMRRSTTIVGPGR